MTAGSPGCTGMTSAKQSRFVDVRRLWAIAVVVFVAGACSGDTSEPSSLALDPATRAMASDLDTSVRGATRMLLDSSGIDIEQTEEVDGVVASQLWMDYRPQSGDFVNVESVDTLIRSRALDEDGGVLTTATILVDDSLFEAVAASPDMPPSASTPWHVVYEDLPEGDSDPMLTFIDLEDMADGQYTSDPTANDAYRRDSKSGAIEWILISPLEEGTSTQRWLIGTDGILKAYTVAFEGHATALDGPKGLPSEAHLAFTPVDPSGPIAEPSVGNPLELDDDTLP